MTKPPSFALQVPGLDKEEAELLSRVRSRDADALIVLYQKYGSRVLSLLCRILEDQSTAEEVLQDTFYRLWTRVELFDPTKGSLISWLFTVGRNLALDLKRKESRRANLNVLLEGDQHSDGQAMSLEGLAVAAPEQSFDEVREAMQRLPEDQRRVIELAYWEGLTHEELAVRLGEPLGTVKTRTRLAFKKLREYLSSDWRF
jgi:RNA polymerase sigma-70 factor (ECF subfamily)